MRDGFLKDWTMSVPRCESLFLQPNMEDAYSGQVQPEGLDISPVLGLNEVLFVRGQYRHVDYISSTFQIRSDGPRHRLVW